MPVRCYRVGEFEIHEDGPRLIVTVETLTLSPPDTNIRELLDLVARRVDDLGSAASLFDSRHRYSLIGATRADVERLLRAHGAPSVTAMIDCDVALCLDFYKIPPDEEAGTPWQDTEVGELVRTAKYGRKKAARERLSGIAGDLVELHPVLRSLTSVAAMPSSVIGLAPPASLARRVANDLTARFAVPTAQLDRVKTAAFVQKSVPEGVDADENQSETMRAENVGGERVLVLDDAMQDGSTAREAVRALRADGAASIMNLSLAKGLKGTKGYRFND